MIPSIALGPIQGSVCRLEQFGLGFAFGPDLHSEADRDGNVSRSGRYRTGRDRGPQALIHSTHVVLPGVLGEHHELVAAMAAQDVMSAQVPLNETDETAQHIVSGLVAVGVVDLLELIDVADPHGQLIVVPFLPGNLPRQEDGERPAIEDARQGVVHGLVGESISSLGQSRLQLDHAPAHFHPGQELAGVEGFRQVVVCSGLQSGHDVRLLTPRGQEDDVGRLVGLDGACAVAHIHTGEPGHYPIEDGQPRRVGSLHRLPCLVAVYRDHHVVAVLRQHPREDQARRDVVVGDKDPHGSGTRVTRAAPAAAAQRAARTSGGPRSRPRS